MRASVFVGVSVDGFIARPDGSFDFLSTGEAEPEPFGFDEFLASVDAIVMGRNTYEVVLTISPWPYGEKPLFILTSRPLASSPSGISVERLSGTPQEILATLASRGFERVYVDGGLTIQSFLRAGLIDDLTISRVPVLIGSGIPLFGALDSDIRLQHVATRQFHNGLVQSEYAVATLPVAR